MFLWLPVVGIGLIAAGLLLRSRKKLPPAQANVLWQTVDAHAKALSRRMPEWGWAMFKYVRDEPQNVALVAVWNEDQESLARVKFDNAPFEGHDFILLKAYPANPQRPYTWTASRGSMA